MAKHKAEGLEKIGPGRWRARIVWRDHLGKRHDTDRVIEADTIGQAIAERERIREELAGVGDEWRVQDAIDAYLNTLRSGTRAVRRTHLRRFAERFGQLRLSHVRTADVQRWLSSVDASDATANAHRAGVSALYKFARERGRLRGEDPIARTIPRRTPKTSEELVAELEAPPARKALVGDELPRFFTALLEQAPDLYPLARCQLLLGCRWSEVSALQWRDIDWSTGIVTIRRAQSRDGEIGPPKGKRARSSAVGPEGLAFLRGHRAAMEAAGWPGSDTWVFPRPPTQRERLHDTWAYSTAQQTIKAVLQSLGLELVTATHAMRHSHVTLARALEADAALRASVGHSDEQLTERYTDESHRQAVAQSFASQLENRLGGGVFGGASVTDLRKTRQKRS